MSLVTIVNPFRSSVVSDPWELPETDVASVHQAAFARCCEAVTAIRAHRHTTSVLVHGEAGSGKTHLLARLRAHIAREAEADGPGGLQEAIFISVRLHTSARMIWRHLRNCLVSDLLRQSGDGTQLERLLLHLLGNTGLADSVSRCWLAQRRQEAHYNNFPCHELEELFERVDGVGRLSYNLRTVLGHLLLGRHRGLASAWLRGESLPETALQKLGITAGQDGDEEMEEQAHQLVIALCSLATAEAPIVFCFDQVEALQLDPQDVSGLIALGQTISALHAETKHALLISCIQSAFLETLHQAVRGADLARVREFAEVSLNPLTWTEAQQLIKARMDALPELKQLRAAQNDPLWPLQETEIKPVFTATGCTARRLIAHCADLFEVQRRGDGVVARPSPPPAAEVFLDQALGERRQKALETSEPAQTEQIITHGLPSLLHLTGKRWRQESQNIPAGVDLLFESPAGRVAVGVCNSKHGPSMVKKLDRLRKLTQDEPATRLVLLRDSRLPIGPTAIKTRALREQLLERGARWVEPSVEALAALDALRRLLSDAKSGELDNHGETVGLQTVQDWLVANLAAELKDLLEEILPEEPGAEPIIIDLPLYEDIAELLQRHHVVSVADAATLLGREVKEIAECAQQHVDRIGVLGEPPSVLFHLVSDGLAA